MHGELPEVAAHPGPVLGSDRSGVTCRSVRCVHAEREAEGEVSLGEPLAEAQVHQVGSQRLVLLLAEEVGLLLALLVQPQ